MNRIVLHVVHKQSVDRWVLEQDRAALANFSTKDEAVHDGMLRAQAHWRNGRVAQLMVHRLDGSFETEHTYGEDPSSSPG